MNKKSKDTEVGKAERKRSSDKPNWGDAGETNGRS